MIGRTKTPDEPDDPATEDCKPPKSSVALTGLSALVEDKIARTGLSVLVDDKIARTGLSVLVELKIARTTLSAAVDPMLIRPAVAEMLPSVTTLSAAVEPMLNTVSTLRTTCPYSVDAGFAAKTRDIASESDGSPMTSTSWCSLVDPRAITTDATTFVSVEGSARPMLLNVIAIYVEPVACWLKL